MRNASPQPLCKRLAIHEPRIFQLSDQVHGEPSHGLNAPGEFIEIGFTHVALPSTNYQLTNICAAKDYHPLQNGNLFGRRHTEGFPMTRRNYKRVPTSLKSAFEQDKEQGIRTRGL